MTTIQDLGEQALLAQLQRFSPADITGDDAAIVPSPHPESLVVSADMLVEGVHFSDQTTSGFDVGWRAMAANLSDLAAMGAQPVGMTITLGLPGTTPLAWVLALYEGLTACLKSWPTVNGQGCPPILGGDVCRSPIRTLSISVLGQVPPERAIYRHRAQAGDWIIATGIHGASRAGLAGLLEPHTIQNLNPHHWQTWRSAHQRPQPRLDLVPSLQGLNARIAGMDSSDGLADAVGQICRASHVGAEIWMKTLPIPAGLIDWVGPSTAIAWTLYGGEDFELILTMAEATAQQWLQILSTTLDLSPERLPRQIGLVTAQPDICLINTDGTATPLTPQKGFQHF